METVTSSVFQTIQMPLPSTIVAEWKARNTPVKTLNKTESKIDIHAPTSPQFSLTRRSKEQGKWKWPCASNCWAGQKWNARHRESMSYCVNLRPWVNTSLWHSRNHAERQQHSGRLYWQSGKRTFPLSGRSASKWSWEWSIRDAATNIRLAHDSSQGKESPRSSRLNPAVSAIPEGTKISVTLSHSRQIFPRKQLFGCLIAIIWQ